MIRRKTRRGDKSTGSNQRRKAKKVIYIFYSMRPANGGGSTFLWMTADLNACLQA